MPKRQIAGKKWIELCRSDCIRRKERVERCRTAKLPGAFRAIVQPHPRYSDVPSSETIRRSPRPRKASGFTWRLILSTSSGRRSYQIPDVSTTAATVFHNYTWYLRLRQFLLDCPLNQQ